MAFENFNIVSRLWRKAGLKNIILSEEARTAPGKTTGAESGIGAHDHRANFVCSNVDTKVIPKAPDHILRQQNPAKFSPPSQTHSQPRAQRYLQDQTPVNDQQSHAIWTPAPLESFPYQWKLLFEKTRPAFAAWSYCELSKDLSHQPVNEIEEQARKFRRKFLQDILRQLAMPAGSHTFWPCAIQTGDDLQPNPDLFWSGLHHLGCRLVFLFGEDARTACGIPDDNPPCYRGCLIYQYDKLDVLASRPHGLRTTLTIMSKAFEQAKGLRRSL